MPSSSHKVSLSVTQKLKELLLGPKYSNQLRCQDAVSSKLDSTIKPPEVVYDQDMGKNNIARVGEQESVQKIPPTPGKVYNWDHHNDYYEENHCKCPWEK